MADFSNLDIERLYKRLVVMAAAAVRDAPGTFDMGLSAEDLASETLDAFLSSPDALGWSERKGPVEPFLAGVIYNKARTHLRRDKKLGGSLDDEKRNFSPRDDRPTPEHETRDKEFQEKLYKAVGDAPDLRDLIAAVELTTGAHNVNQELAAAMGKTVPQVVNLKRRLINNRRVLELLGYGKGQTVQERT